MDAKLNKTSTVHSLCDKTSEDWFSLWLNFKLMVPVPLVPIPIDCWTDNFRLHYDNVTRTTSNSPGVQTRIPGWGNPEVVEWIDPSKNIGAYFKDIGNSLVSHGYVRKKSLRGAPYDFRKGPSERKIFVLSFSFELKPFRRKQVLVCQLKKTG